MTLSDAGQPRMLARVRVYRCLLALDQLTKIGVGFISSPVEGTRINEQSFEHPALPFRCGGAIVVSPSLTARTRSLIAGYTPISWLKWLTSARQGHEAFLSALVDDQTPGGELAMQVRTS